MRASGNNHVQMVAFLVEHGANVDLQDNDGHTPLMAVCKAAGHADIVAYLMSMELPKIFKTSVAAPP